MGYNKSRIRITKNGIKMSKPSLAPSLGRKKLPIAFLKQVILSGIEAMLEEHQNNFTIDNVGSLTFHKINGIIFKDIDGKEYPLDKFSLEKLRRISNLINEQIIKEEENDN